MNRILALLLALILFSCGYSCIKSKKQPKEKVQEPATASVKTIYDVPQDLSEISGICFIDNENLLAIQDEEGIIYQYNLAQQKVTAQKTFGGPADYEDIAVVGDDVYVVDSEGKIYFIKGFKQGNTHTELITTPFTGKNNIEGLAYDAAGNRLLIAPKDEGFDEGKTKIKDIYEINLKTRELNAKPIYQINLDMIESYFKGDGLEESSKKFLKAIGNQNLNKVFRTSALGVHPKTREIFVLSSINNLIAVLTPQGTLRKIVQLKGKEFSQPEGLAFTPDGNLYISNEANNKTKANIIHLVYEN